MPTVNPPAKVLVSGASGFIGMWVVQTLLERGYAVRGTVRSNEKGRHLQKTFEKYGDKFELAIVPDIAKEGAFDEAVKDVDAIEHTASPFHTHADDPKEMIDPAVNGTLGILNAAREHGCSVRRVVITSSVAAVMANLPEPKLFTAHDWNDQAVESVKRNGKDASGHDKYCASKTLAEKAAWKFYEENRSSIKWDLVVLNPPLVLGPPIHEVHEPSKLNTSLLNWYDMVVSRKEEATSETANNFIDVRDLARAHVDALENGEARGRRFIVTAGPFSWKNFVDLADHKQTVSASKGKKMFCDKDAREVLGMKYHSMEETTKDSLIEFKARGWYKS